MFEISLDVRKHWLFALPNWPNGILEYKNPIEPDTWITVINDVGVPATLEDFVCGRAIQAHMSIYASPHIKSLRLRRELPNEKPQPEQEVDGGT